MQEAPSWARNAQPLLPGCRRFGCHSDTARPAAAPASRARTSVDIVRHALHNMGEWLSSRGQGVMGGRVLCTPSPHRQPPQLHTTPSSPTPATGIDCERCRGGKRAASAARPWAHSSSTRAMTAPFAAAQPAAASSGKERLSRGGTAAPAVAAPSAHVLRQRCRFAEHMSAFTRASERVQVAKQRPLAPCALRRCRRSHRDACGLQ